jgi:hypothetical protein
MLVTTKRGRTADASGKKHETLCREVDYSRWDAPPTLAWPFLSERSAIRRRVLVRLTAAGERRLGNLSSIHPGERESIRLALQNRLERMNARR